MRRFTCTHHTRMRGMGGGGEGEKRRREEEKEGKGGEGQEGIQARVAPAVEEISLQSSRSSSAAGDPLAILGCLVGGVAACRAMRLLSMASFVRSDHISMYVSISSGTCSE